MANGNFKLGKLQLLSSTALTKQAAVFGALGLAFGASSAHALDANALPEGGSVVGGAAAISQSGSAMNINQSTDRTVIDWRSFNIGSSATVDFVQPGASSIAVNRVNSSSNPSDIQGSLTANGQVWILNPNGVLFGKTAKIDVAGIVASTGNINKDAFMRGDNRLQFTGSDGGSVINDGLISVADGGLAAFVAPYVRNGGVIRARVGKVTLAAGTTFTLDLAGDDLIELGLGADQAMVDQSGELLAAGSIVNLTAKAAGQIVDSVINVSGTVLASGVTEKGGQIILTADNITTTDGAVLAADGGTNGDGGTVYAYADKTGNYSGSFSAKGGSASGDGGFVETSGKKVHIAEGISVDTTAANGTIGDWSIDPDDLEVIGSGSGALAAGTNDETSTISAATVVAGLNSSNVILKANNSITVSEAITSAAAGGGVGDLALNDQNADNNLTINLNAKITLGTGKTLSGQGTTVNVGSAGSIQNGVNVASTSGATVTVADGNFAENVTINKSNLTLQSQNGSGATTITGQNSTQLGTVYVNSGANNFQLGGVGKGFTVIGIDGVPGIERAAVYFKGSNSGSTIQGNTITANGDAGLLTEYNAAVTGLTVDSNTFDGKTFTGATAGGLGFGNQFTEANVPRQLVTISGGASVTNTQNITFTNNEITGTAGGLNGSAQEQGNTLVTIDAVGATITGNNFTGTTTRYGDALRARGSNTTISGNTFDGTNMGAATNLVNAKSGALSGTFADMVAGNTWVNAAWVDRLNGGYNYVYRSVQKAVTDALSGDTVNVAEGDYAGTVVIDKGIALQGLDSVNRANLTDGIQLTGAYSDLTLKNLVVSGDGGGNKVVSGGSVTNLTVDNVKIDGGNVDNRFGFAGGKTYGDISITNSQFVDINGWAAFDNSTGGSATALTSVNFSNNLLDNVQGHIAFRQLNATDVTISGNTVRNTGSDTNSFGGIFKVFKGGTVDFEGNTVSDIGTSGFNPAGEAAYGAVLLTRDVTTLNVTDNTFTNNNQVFAVEPGKALPGTTNFSGNTFTNNGYAIYTPTNISGGGTINFSGTNNFIAGVDTVQHIVWRSASALDLTGVQFDGKLGSAMTNAELFAVEDLITHGMDSDAAGLATVKADNVYVTSTGSIARGVAKVAAGDTVNVDGGTFALGTSQLNINKALTLQGAGEGVTNISTTSTGYGISVTGNDVTLSDFTFNGNPSGSYGIKVSPTGAASNRLTNFAISNVTVDNSYRTGLDLNGVNGATIDNVNVTGVDWGNGISLTDSANVTVTNSTTSGNAWGGLAIYQANRSYDQQVNNITIDGTNSFGEANPVYMQDESDGTTAHGGVNGLDIGTVNIAGFTLAGHNTDASDKYTYLNNTVTALADWLQVKGQLVDGYVTGWTGSAANNEFFVGHATDTTAMSIASAQANSATGNTINVGSGSFAEDVVVADARVFKFDGSTLNSYTQSVASSIGGTVTSVGGFVMNALTNLVSDTTLNGAVTAQSIAGVGSDLNVSGGATVLNGSSYQAASLNFNGTSTTLTAATTTFNTAVDNGDITFTGPIFGTTTDLQNVNFNAGTAGDISLQNAGTNSVWLGTMSATGHDFSAATVFVNSFFSTLTGNQTFTTDTLHTKGAVTSTVGGNASGPVNAGGNVNINAGGAFNGNVSAPTTTVSGSTVTGTFAGTTANLTAGSSLNVTTNVTTLNVNAPSGTVSGTYTTLDNTGGPLVINGKTVQGSAPTNPNQIIVEGFTLPAGAFITSSGEIILPSGMMVGLVSPAAGPGASGGKPKVVIVHNVHMLGQLLSEGYVAIIVDLSKDSDEMEELAMN
jgi:filamentous hemagglutinin family protein